MSLNSAQSDLNRGLRLFHNEEYKAAIPALKKNFEKDNDVESGYHLALCYAQIQDYDNTLKVFDLIIKRMDTPLRVLQAHIITGYIYTIREMYDLAELEFKDALGQGFENQQIHSALGFVYYKKKDFNNSVQHLKKAVELNPNNPNAHNSLGYVLADAGGDLEEAIKEIRLALELDDQNPAYIDSLGFAYFKKKDYFNARRFLTRAFELAPNNKDVKEHLLALEAASPAQKPLMKKDKF